MTYYKQLDGLRALAVFGVMTAHWIQPSMDIPFAKNIPFGTGVTLFFVLSGFLITTIILDFKEKNIAENQSQLHSMKSFFIRRSLRIFPIYYLALFLLLFVGFSNVQELFPWLATFSTNIYMAIHNTYIQHFTHFWSLAVEEQFYLGWIFIAVFTPRKWLQKIIIVLITLSVLCLYYFQFHLEYRLMNLLTICQMHALGFGALIAYFVKYEKQRIEKINISAMKTVNSIFAVLFAFIFIYRNPPNIYESMQYFQDFGMSVIYFLIVLTAVNDGFKGIAKKILESGFMRYIGRISYGLYLYHLFMSPLYFYFANIVGGSPFSNPISLAGVFFIMNGATAVASWHVIEKPINNFKRHFQY